MNKEQFRKSSLKKIKKASLQNKRYKDFLCMQALKKVLEEKKYQSILFYLPLGMEINIGNFLRQSRRKGRCVYVPFMQGESFKMVTYRLPLKRGRFNIKEPNCSLAKHNKVDVILVPVVGVDGTFRRIGFGKGMYDRFYTTLKNKPVVIFLQIETCLYPKTITDSYDIRADYYITPKEIFEYRGKLDVGRSSYRRYRGSR